MNPAIYALLGAAIGILVFNIATMEKNKEEPRCIVNTHLTPEQYIPDQDSEFFGMYKGDVLALEPCK